MATLAARPRTVEAEINYIGPMDSLPYFYAKDHARDNLLLEPHRVEIADARQAVPAPSLEREGCTLAPHRSAVSEFEVWLQTSTFYPAEIVALI